MRILELFMVALMPVLKTLLIAVLGLVLALDRVNILSKAARHHLNNLVFYVFFPSLLASGLVDSITAKNVVSLWFTPVSILLTYIVGSAAGWILVKLTRTPKQLHGLVIGCCAAGNMGNLPVIIIPAICAEKNNPFGEKTTCSANGLAYVSLSMGIGAICAWSYVYNIVRAYGTKGSSETEADKNIGYESAKLFLESCIEASPSRACPEIKEQQASLEPLLEISPDENKMQAEGSMAFRKFFKSFIQFVDLRMVFRPPTIATIIGLTIGVVSPIREVMVGNTAPFRVVNASVRLLGEAAIPSMTLIMGANLLKGFKSSGVGLPLVIGTIIVRFIGLPLLGVSVVKGAQNLGLVGSDPLFHFVLLLQYSVPPAMAIGTITQLFEIGETECSVIIFWNYAVASIALTIWSTYYMWILS